MKKTDPTALIKICTCLTEGRAIELMSLLNQKGYIGGISRKEDKLFLCQGTKPYSPSTIKLIKEFAKAWNKLINKISV